MLLRTYQLALTKTKQIAGLNGSELNLFFRKHLYQYDSSLSSTRTDNFQAATLDEAKEKLKNAYNLMKSSEANFLEKTINVASWLEKAYEIYLEIHPKTLNGVNGLKNLLERVKVILGSSDKLQGYWSLMLNLENLHYLLTASMLILNTLEVCSMILKSLHNGNKNNCLCVTDTSLCYSCVLHVLTAKAIGRISRFFVSFLVLCRLLNCSVRSYWSE